MKPQAPYYSETLPELKAADSRWPEWRPWLAGSLWFCPMYSSRPLAAALCKSLHPSVSSEGNVFHCCTSVLLPCLGSPRSVCAVTTDLRSQPLGSCEMTTCFFLPEKPLLWGQGGSSSDPKKNTVLSSCTITATDSPSCHWSLGPLTVHLHAGVHAFTEMFHSLELVLFSIPWVAFTAGTG